jgi:outer membrane protein assembly factor BamB
MPKLRLVAELPPANDRIEGPSGGAVLAALVPLFDDLVPLEPLCESGAVALARELAFAVGDLVAGARERAVVPTEAPGPGASWEVGLERDGDELAVTLFRQGDRARVAQTGRRLALEAARQAVLAALEAAGGGDRGLGLARDALERAHDEAPPSTRRASHRPVELRSSKKSALVLRATFELRELLQAAPSDVARADLFPLLFRGDLVLTVGKSRRGLGDAHLFLLAEQLVALASAALRARPGRPGTLRRLLPGGVSCGVELDGRGDAILHVSDGSAEDSGAGGWRLPPVPCRDLAVAAKSFGARLVGAVVAVDPSQRHNLRLTAFRRALRELAAELGAGLPAPIRNEAPASYRAFVESAPPPAVSSRPVPGKLRFEEAWRADVPGLDLHAVFVAGERMVVGSTRELACIDRASGHILWTRRTHRAASVMTPAGVARIGADGLLAVHDVATGDSIFRVQLRPCSGASTSGAVIATPGLPRMLLVGEGSRHLVAVDLASGEVRWRRAVKSRDAQSRQPVRLRPAGKLVVVASGEPVLAALDLLTGEVVWRTAGAGRYVHAALDAGELFALSVGSDAASVERIEPWTGTVAWRTTLPRGMRPSAPIAAGGSVVIAAKPPRGEPGAALVALDRATGTVRWERPPTRGRLACVGLDDLVLCNGEDGTLVALDAQSGEARWRRLLCEGRAADRPAALAPVLRSGALFVPQAELYVVRPADGALLGRLPTDLVPDALRVDAECGVYVAEASGYVAAYRALPALRLV